MSFFYSQKKTRQKNTEQKNAELENTEQINAEQENTAQEKTEQEKTEQEKNRRRKLWSVFSSVVLILLMVLVDLIVVKTVGGFSAVPKKIGGKKGLRLAVLNLLVIGMTLYGERLYRWMEKKSRVVVRVLDWAALAALPAILFFLVQRLIGKSYAVETDYLSDNLVICYWLFLVFLMLFSQAAVGCFSYTLLLMVLALAEYFVYRFRGQSITLLDIFNVGTAMSVAGGYSYKIYPRKAMLLLMFLFILAFQLRMQKLRFGKRNVKNFCARVGGLLLLCEAAYFGRGLCLDSLNCYLWNLHQDYMEKGYIYTLAKEIRYLKIETPDGYSTNRVEAAAEEGADTDGLAEKTEANSLAEKTDTDGQADSLAEETDTDGLAAEETETVIPENLIVIMNESFTDFSEVGEIAADEDVLAAYHALQEEENVKSGGLSVSIFGAGTSQTEYEVLTGNSVSFQPVGSIAYQLYTGDPEYGMAASLKAQGYTAVAIHPNRSSAWSRKKVYANMQFDRFISIKEWDIETEKLRGKVTDENTYEQLIHVYEEKEEDEKMFLFCVTIQNHADYGEDSLDGFEPTVELSYDENYPLAEVYLSLLKESDAAFAQLIDYFRDVEEPTMIVMFGDHWPSLEEGFYAELTGKTYEELDTDGLQQRYTTPYVIWTNYPSEGGSEDMSANYFGAYLTSLAGLELTPYQEFLLRMKEEIPVVTSGMLRTADGNWVSTDALTGEAAEWMEDYQILEYNNVFDRKNRIKELFSLG